MSQNTLYIAAPIFSVKLQKFDSEAVFPPFKKIGITTDHFERREKELMGTLSPVKIAIIKAWTNIDARKVESILHTILDNTRLDGEYFWDGNETLLEAVTDFIHTYHPEAKEIKLTENDDVVAATKAAQKQSSQRIYSEVIPALDELSIKHSIIRNGDAVSFKVGEYSLYLGGRTGGRYTLTIMSQTKTAEDALSDFPGAQAGMEGSNRLARIPLGSLDEVMKAVKSFKDALK